MNDCVKVEQLPVNMKEDCDGYVLELSAEYSRIPAEFYFRDVPGVAIRPINGKSMRLYLSEGKQINEDQIICIYDLEGEWDEKQCMDIFEQYAKQYKIDLRIFFWHGDDDALEIRTFLRNGIKRIQFMSYSEYMWSHSTPYLGKD